MRKILIKQIVTEQGRDKLRAQFMKQKMQLEQECQQLQFEEKKMQRQSGLHRQEIANRFELEKSKRADKIALLNFKLEQLAILEIGSEIIEREVEALVEVSVGSKEAELFAEKAIVLKDGFVVRIDR